MARTYSETLHEATAEYLDNLDMDNLPDIHDIEADILDLCTMYIKTANAIRDKDDKWHIPHTLTNAQIASVILKLYNVKNIMCADENASEDYDLLAVYQTSGVDRGTYTTRETDIGTLIRTISYNASTRDVNEVIAILKAEAPHVPRNDDKDLIAVNNGIFNYKTKTLSDFDPNIVFIAKSHVDYNQNAINPVIHNDTDNTDWDVESWIKDLSDDPEVVNVIWEILGAIIRPNVSWNKSAWFYSNTGNNGKGTLCALMRNLTGYTSYASISLAAFSKDFMLEPLIRASSIIVDENDVGVYIDRCADLKAVITNDIIQLNRKYKMPIAYQFRGFMVQCLNEYPRIKDTSDSFYRRQLFIPFEKCFTGQERRYIKNDYLRRSEVLEYVLYKVLNMNYYELSEPAVCRQALVEYKQFNDPVRQYLDEMLPQFVWDLLPYGFLYDVYKEWFSRNSPSGKPQGRSTFINDVKNVIKDYPEWDVANNGNGVAPDPYITKPEPLIGEYNIQTWMNTAYTGGSTDVKYIPILKTSYKGLIRV